MVVARFVRWFNDPILCSDIESIPKQPISDVHSNNGLEKRLPYIELKRRLSGQDRTDVSVRIWGAKPTHNPASRNV